MQLLVSVVKTLHLVALGPRQDEVTVVPHIIWSNYPAFREVFYLIYRVSSKTVPTWLFALLSASTHANCKSWDVFEKFRKFATR